MNHFYLVSTKNRLFYQKKYQICFIEIKISISSLILLKVKPLFLFCSMQKKLLIILKNTPIHFLCWVVIWFFFRSFFSVGTSNQIFLFWFSSLLSIVTLITAYVFVYDLIPKYLLIKQYKKFVLYTIYSGVFVAATILMIEVVGFVFYFNLEFKQMPALTTNPAVILVCIFLL